VNDTPVINTDIIKPDQPDWIKQLDQPVFVKANLTELNGRLGQSSK